MTTLSDLSSSGPWHVLIYGKPGTGKTVMAHTWPRTRTIDCDGGMASVLWAIKKGIIQKQPEEVVYETVRELEMTKSGFVSKATAVDRVTSLIDDWYEKECDEWDTLIIDSATAFNEFVFVRALENMGDLKYSQSWSDSKRLQMQVRRIQDYGGAMTLFRQFVERCRGMTDKHFILVCHEYNEVNENTGTITGRLPLLIGNQLRQDIPRMFSEVWWTHTSGPRQNLVYKTQTASDSTVMAKSRLGCLDADEEFLTYDKMVAKVKEFWGEPAAAKEAVA